MKRIGIIYICTGPYNVFWKDFYESIESLFLPNTEKHYYVFSDCESVYGQHSNFRIHKYNIEHQPWPLITLFRFKTFLSIEQDLMKNDYVMYANSNLKCENLVLEEEFLPRTEFGEKLFVTTHIGFFSEKPWRATYERSEKSLAYVPYNCSQHYVAGGMNGGITKSFLDMSRILLERTEADLKRNVIARWHDESHLNRYIIGHNDFRLLSPSYCYADGFGYRGLIKLRIIPKEEKFNVNKFKGYSSSKESQNSTFKQFKNFIKACVSYDDLFYIRDCILKKSIKTI